MRTLIVFWTHWGRIPLIPFTSCPRLEGRHHRTHSLIIVNDRTIFAVQPILRVFINGQSPFPQLRHGQASRWARPSSRDSTTPRRVVTERAGLRPPRRAPKCALHVTRIFRRRIWQVVRRPGTSAQPGVRVSPAGRRRGYEVGATPPPGYVRQWVRLRRSNAAAANTSATTIGHFGVNAAAIIKENDNINHSVSYPSRPERLAKLLAVLEGLVAGTIHRRSSLMGLAEQSCRCSRKTKTVGSA